MRKLDFNEYKLCQILGNIFENSITASNFSSPMFIRRIMMSEEVKSFVDKSYLMLSSNVDDIIDNLNAKYQPSSKSPMYSHDEMYWIGYIYLAICFLYNLTAKKVYKLFSSKEIIKYYNIYHTFDIEEAAERMMENINYVQEDYTIKGLQIMMKLYLLDKLKSMLGKKVKVYIDRPIGSIHPNYDDIVYTVNYGYIKDIIALDGEYQDAYVLGVDEPINEIEGIVIAVVNRNNDVEDKVIVSVFEKEYSDEEIKYLINFQEKYFNFKIIR